MSEKKKHHTLRVQMPVRNAMDRLQDEYGEMAFQIHKIDVTGYDLTFRGIRISLREDAATMETIIFIEHDGTDRNSKFAEALEERLDPEAPPKPALPELEKPPDYPVSLPETEMGSHHPKLNATKYEIEIDAPPVVVVEHLKKLEPDTGFLGFAYGDIPGTYKLDYWKYRSTVESSIKTRLYVYEIDNGTRTSLIYYVSSEPTFEVVRGSLAGCFIVSLLSILSFSLLSLSSFELNTLIVTMLVFILVPLVFVLALFIRNYVPVIMGKNYQLKQTHDMYSRWLLASLQAIPQTIDPATHDDVEAAQQDMQHTPDENMRRANE